MKYILLFFALMFCTAGDYYQPVIPGMPIGVGKRLGGTWKKVEPKCDHDISTLKLLKKESIRNAANWRRIAFGTACLSFIALIIWYLTKLTQAGGVACLSVLFSLFSTFMAVLVTTTWLLVLACLGVALIGLGVYLHKKSFFKFLKHRRDTDGVFS